MPLPPEHLRINGRSALPSIEFKNDEKLYFAYCLADLDENEKIDIDSIRTPNTSGNWSRFSFPEDVQFIENKNETHGCYSVRIEFIRIENTSTPVHDPIETLEEFQNYSHSEIRPLKDGESIYSEPEGNRNATKSKRLKVKEAIVKNHNFEKFATV